MKPDPDHPIPHIDQDIEIWQWCACPWLSKIRTVVRAEVAWRRLFDDGRTERVCNDCGECPRYELGDKAMEAVWRLYAQINPWWRPVRYA